MVTTVFSQVFILVGCKCKIYSKMYEILFLYPMIYMKTEIINSI